MDQGLVVLCGCSQKEFVFNTDAFDLRDRPWCPTIFAPPPL